MEAVQCATIQCSSALEMSALFSLSPMGTRKAMTVTRTGTHAHAHTHAHTLSSITPISVARMHAVKVELNEIEDTHEP